MSVYQSATAIRLRQHVPPPPWFFGFHGPPGSGKDTQSKILAGMLNCYVLTSGDLLREIRDTPGHPHQAICQTMHQTGDLAPSWLVNHIVEEKTREMLQAGFDGIIFNGVARRLDQAEHLDELLGRLGYALQAAIELVVTEEVCQQRLLAKNPDRAERTDDNPTAIAHRLEAYALNLTPIEDYYRLSRRWYPVNASGSPESVTAALVQQLPNILQVDSRLA